VLTTRVPSTVCQGVFSFLYSSTAAILSLFFPTSDKINSSSNTTRVRNFIVSANQQKKTRSGHLNVNASKKPKCSLKCLLGPPELSTLSRHFHAVPCPNLSRHFHAVPCPAQEFETSPIDLVLALGFHLCIQPNHQPFNLCPELLMA